MNDSLPPSPFHSGLPTPAASPAPRRPPDLRTAQEPQEHHKAGQLAEAESAYRQWLSLHPADAAALHGLGLVNHQGGRQHEALGLLRQAVRAAGSALSPSKGAEYRSNLAAVMGRLGQHRYAEAAIALATDLPRLAEVRRGLRERMRQSAIVDAAGFARKQEAAYRQMWGAWCERARGTDSGPVNLIQTGRS